MYSMNQMPSPWLGMTPEQKQQMLLAQNEASQIVEPGMVERFYRNDAFKIGKPVEKSPPVIEAIKPSTSPTSLPNLDPAGVAGIANAFKKKGK